MLLVVCRARHTFLRVSLKLSNMEVKASPKPSQMEAKGIVLSQRGSGDGALCYGRVTQKAFERTLGAFGPDPNWANLCRVKGGLALEGPS